MQTYANALLIAIPIFSLLIVAEAIYGRYKGLQTLRSFDTISSLSSGITNVIKDSLGLVIIIVSYPFMVEYLAIFSIQESWMLYLLGFIAIDFAGYWSHRLNHSVNFFWNNHVIHHSSEEFNLACALRQSISNILGIYSFFLIPAAIIGIPAKIIQIIAPIHLFLQFWYHTRHVPKLGFLEYIIITPSQHRVHHAINPEYIDKNIGQIFSIWDRLFGTFQEELDDVPPVYGVTRPVNTWNPIRINFQHVWLLAKDAWRTKNWADKFKIWFKPTGWRPADVKEKYPVNAIEDVYDFQKYDAGANASAYLKAWIWMQFMVTAALLLYMFYHFSDIGGRGLLIYGGLVFAGIYGYTAMMDNDRHALWVELLRSIGGLLLVFSSGDWFGLAASFPAGVYLIAGYFAASAIGALYFTVFEPRAKGSGPFRELTTDN